jgi:large subunit ribosomal protein L10
VKEQRREKEEAVALLQDRLQRCAVAVFTEYRGLDVAEVTQLRAKLREAGIEFKVVKNTLTQIAANNLGLEDLESVLTGPTAAAFGFDDPVAPAKILSQFAKDHKNLGIKGGLLEGKFIGMDQVKALADLPAREQLLAQVMGTLQAPLYGLVNVLNGPIQKLVYALEAVREQKETATA